MNKIFTLSAAMMIGLSASAQITINSTDMPAPTGLYHVRYANFAQVNPTTGANQTWNYDTTTTRTGIYTTYQETDPYFTPFGIDAYRGTNKTFGSFIYTYFQELDFNTSSVALRGYYKFTIPKQVIPGGATTDSVSSTADSGTVAAMPIIAFPMTYSSAWHNVSAPISFTFFFTVPAASLSNYPVQHVFHVHQDDSVVGWGKMRIYNSVSHSINYDVLMDKRISYNVDSFYSSGAPLAATALTYFNLTQGMHTDTVVETNFYRASTYCPLARFGYNKDVTFTSQSSIMFDSSIAVAVGVNEVNTPAYTTVLYPNPATGNNINMIISGAAVKSVEYSIADMTGKVIATGNTTLNGNNISIPFTSSMVNGNYILFVADKQNAFEAKEEFTINR